MTQIGTTIATLPPLSTTSSEAGLGAQADASNDATSFLRSLSANTNSNSGSFGSNNPTASPPPASQSAPSTPSSGGSASNGSSSSQNGNSATAGAPSNGS